MTAPAARPAMSDDEKAIRTLIDTWLTASQAGDLQTVLGLMSDDVVFLVAGQQPFEAKAEVVEPMGNETLVFFPLNGIDVCANVDPGCGAEPGKPLKLVADLRHLHLIDDSTGRVL